MANFCRRISENENFQTFILFLILAVAISMGLEAIPQLADDFGIFFIGLHYVAQAVFAFEIIVRIGAYAPSFRSFFYSKWNFFDFVIVLFSFAPNIGGFALVGRLLRTLRVFRIFSVSPHLRGFIDRLKCTFDEIAYVGLIVTVLGYIFTIAGFYLFVEVDPQHWGNLRLSAFSVMHLLLFQNLSEYTKPVTAVSFAYLAYFLIFYLTFVSLFFSALVAAITQEVVQEAKREN
jgi:voltage-gated sodium channel